MLIAGLDLSLGSHYQVALQHAQNNTLVPAFFLPSPMSSVRFISPRLSLGILRVRLSLNAQQFTCVLAV